MLLCKIVFYTFELFTTPRGEIEINIMGWFDLCVELKIEGERDGTINWNSTQSNKKYVWSIGKKLRVEIIIIKEILHGTRLINDNDGNISALPGRENVSWGVNVFVTFLIDSQIPLITLLPLCLFSLLHSSHCHQKFFECSLEGLTTMQEDYDEGDDVTQIKIELLLSCQNHSFS